MYASIWTGFNSWNNDFDLQSHLCQSLSNRAQIFASVLSLESQLRSGYSASAMRIFVWPLNRNLYAMGF